MTEFPLNKSLVILAPNAHGKSSISDAVEFLFSNDGTLVRFGARNSETNVGRKPMIHILRENATVGCEFEYNGATITATRTVDMQGNTLPNELRVFRDALKVPIVFRGHELRNFAETSTPQERYVELSSWLGAERLVEIQRTLHKLKKDFRAAISATCDQGPEQKIIRSSLGFSKSPTRELALVRINKRLTTVGLPPISGPELPRNDLVVASLLKKNTDLEDERLMKTITTAASIMSLTQEDGTSTIVRLAQLERVLAESELAFAKKADFALLLTIVEKSAQYLSENDSLICPVCETAWNLTSLESRDRAIVHLTERQAGLKDQKDLLDIVEKNRHDLATAFEDVRARLLKCRELISNLSSISPVDRELRGIEQLNTSDDLKTFFEVVLAEPAKCLNDMLAASSNKELRDTLALINSLFNAYRKIDWCKNLESKSKEIETEIDRAIELANEKVRTFLQKIVADLSDSCYSFYKTAQEGSPSIPKIELTLSEDTVDQRSLAVNVYFEDGEPSSPKSYLSDSQLNTLALGLRLSALIKLNREAPFVLLDDVVTSYDADHRPRIAQALLNTLEGFRFLILTHDERFFEILRERALPSAISAQRITTWSLKDGPRLLPYQDLTQRIDTALANGENPGNYIRIAEEEWLRQMGTQFEILIPLLPPEKAHHHDRAKLAEGLIRELKAMRVQIPDTQFLRSRFLIALKDGTIENFASHFQADPASTDSIGIQRDRWNEFMALRNIFSCGNVACVNGRWKRVGKDHAFCSKCGSAFDLQARAGQLWPQAT